MNSSTLPLVITFTVVIPQIDETRSSRLHILNCEMIVDFLNSLFGSERGQTEQQETILAPVVTDKASNGKAEPGKYDSDIEAITGKWGELKSGLCIETTLQDLLVIVPRQRPRVDAYNGLVSLLRDKYGVTLTIKSRKTKKDSNELHGKQTEDSQ